MTGRQQRELDEERVAVFDRERPHLLAVAFRLLGSDSDAQDVAQEAWIRYAHADLDGVRNIGAWLTTVVTRLCVDLLRRRREDRNDPAELLETSPDRADTPEDVALLASEVTEALLVVIDELTPAQRVALILHDVFGTPFEEIARVLDTTEASAKKLASRARARVRRQAAPPAVDRDTAHQVVSAFLKAAQEGDIDGLVRLLHPDVTRTADPQALPAGAAQRARGAGTVVAETMALRGNARRARVVTIDEQPGIMALSEGEAWIALVVRVVGTRIAHYDVIADPHRLALLRIDPIEGLALLRIDRNEEGRLT